MNKTSVLLCKANFSVLLIFVISFTDTYFSYYKSNEAATGAPIQRIDLRGKNADWQDSRVDVLQIEADEIVCLYLII